MFSPKSFLLLAFLLLVSAFSFAQSLMPLHGNLLSNGVPVAGATLRVYVYPALTGASAIYDSGDIAAATSGGGVYDVMLGSVNAVNFDLNYNTIYYLDLNVNGVDIDWSGVERLRFQSHVGGDLNIDGGALSTGGQRRLVITTAGNVGVGTLAPNAKLTVLNGGTLITPVSSTIGLFQNSTATTTNSGLSIISGTSGISSINLGDAASETVGRIDYNNIGDIMQFYVGGQNAGFIDSVSNTSLGYQSLQNTDGNYNTAFGYNALKNNTLGYYNTAVGIFSLAANTTGYWNTGTGMNSLNSNTIGYSNTGVGASSLQVNTTGYWNTGVGVYSLLNNTFGNNNTGVGVVSLRYNTSGNYNTALGVEAGSISSTLAQKGGWYNTYLGYLTGPASDQNYWYTTVIGAGAKVDKNNSIVLGGVSGTGYDVNVGIGTTAPMNKLNIIGDLNVSAAGKNTVLKNDGNITLTSPNGTAFNCGVTNGGVFQCT